MICSHWVCSRLQSIFFSTFFFPREKPKLWGPDDFHTSVPAHLHRDPEPPEPPKPGCFPTILSNSPVRSLSSLFIIDASAGWWSQGWARGAEQVGWGFLPWSKVLGLSAWTWGQKDLGTTQALTFQQVISPLCTSSPSSVKWGEGSLRHKEYHQNHY